MPPAIKQWTQHKRRVVEKWDVFCYNEFFAEEEDLALKKKKTTPLVQPKKLGDIDLKKIVQGQKAKQKKGS